MLKTLHLWRKTIYMSALDSWPVGSVYIAVDSTSPATRFGGGTWAAFGVGRVLVGLDAGDVDFDTAEEIGGAKTVSAAGINSALTFTGSALGTHSHGAGTLVPSAHSGAAVTDHASHTHSYTDIVNHTHPVTDPGHVHTQRYHSATTGPLSGPTTAPDTSSNTPTNYGITTASGTTGISTNNPVGGVASGTTAGPSATLTHSVTQPAAHTMSGSSEALSAGTPAGTVSTPTFTGSLTSVVQPYITVYMWKRTA